MESFFLTQETLEAITKTGVNTGRTLELLSKRCIIASQIDETIAH